MKTDKYNLWQLILHLKDNIDFKILETKITTFKELVDQGHANEMVKSALKKGKINISADFVENDQNKKLLLKDVIVLTTKSKHGNNILTDITVADVLVDGVSIFQSTKDTGIK